VVTALESGYDEMEGVLEQTLSKVADMKVNFYLWKWVKLLPRLREKANKL